MSDNETLLQENTVKRFMTLAGNQTLAENFLNENKKLWEQVPGEDMPPMDTEAPPELMPDMGDVEEPMPDMGDVEGEDEVEDVDLTAEEAEVLIGLGKKLEAEVGGEEDLEMGPEAEAAEAAMPPIPETEAPPELLPGEEEEEEGAALEEAFVRELSRRVTERVRREQLSKELQEQVVQRVQKEQLVETVMKRVAQRLRDAKKKRK